LAGHLATGPLQEGAQKSRSLGSFISLAMVCQQSPTRSKQRALRQQKKKEHLKNPECRAQSMFLTF